MRLKLFIIILSLILVLCSCSNNKIIYSVDNFIKEYFEKPENKNIIDVSSLKYSDNNKTTSVICENSNYVVGVHKYIKETGKWSSVIYTTYINDTKDNKIIYTDIIKDLIKGKYGGFEIPLFYNKYTYYDPLNDEYKDIIGVKEKSDSYAVFTVIFCEVPFIHGTRWLCPSLMSESFYNEIKSRAQKNGIENIIDEFYEKKSKAEIIDYYDDSFKKYFNLDKLGEILYKLRSRSTEPFDEIGSFLFSLGYTPQDIRKEIALMGFNENAMKCAIAEIKVDLSSEKPIVTYEIFNKSN